MCELGGALLRRCVLDLDSGSLLVVCPDLDSPDVGQVKEVLGINTLTSGDRSGLLELEADEALSARMLELCLVREVPWPPVPEPGL